MANFKSDVEANIIRQKDKLLKDVPDFLYTYFEEYLPGISNELRSHIAYAKDIINFLRYYSLYLKKEVKDITLEDMDMATKQIMNEYFKYITQYKVTYITKNNKEVSQIRTNSLTSKARKLSALKKLYEYLNRYKLVANNPVIDMKIAPPEVTKLNNKLDALEVNELYDEILKGNNIESNFEVKAHERLKIRDINIFIILAYTGIRVSELVSLDVSDVDTNKCTITINRKNNKIEEIPYPMEVSKFIDDYMDYRRSINGKVYDEYKKALFISQHNKRITEQSVRNIIKKYAGRINIDDIACHTLRRTLLSTLYNKTGDIKLTARIGGHSISTASKYYVNVDDERLRDTMKEFKY